MGASPSTLVSTSVATRPRHPEPVTFPPSPWPPTSATARTLPSCRSPTPDVTQPHVHPYQTLFPSPSGPAPPPRAPPIGPPACPSAPGPTPQARLSCAYVGLDSRGLEELPLEPERRKEAKYQQRRGGSGARPRFPLPAARLSAPAPPAGAQAPRRRPGPARTPASFVIPPARSCGCPVLKIPRTGGEGHPSQP